MIKYILFIIIGFIFLIKGADFLVDGASEIAKKFGISNIIIGLTIVSIGTSMPELFVSITSSAQGLGDISVGNVVGSNLCNLLLILGLVSVIRNIKIEKNTKYIEIPFLVIINLIFFILTQDGIISQKESTILVFLFISFLVYTVVSSKNQNSFELVSQSKKISIIKSIIKIIVGIVALKYGGQFVVNNSTSIAKIFRIRDKVIGATIIAVGTSLPELVTSIIAAIKKNTDIAIGNIIGSNIFNILLIVGVSSFIRTIHLNSSYNMDLIILYITSFILFLIPHIGKKGYMTRISGLFFLFVYCTYVVQLIMA